MTPRISILAPDADRTPLETSELPACFHDLNLDQIIAAATAPFEDYNLTPYFHTSLYDLEAVAYRQEVMRNLEQPAVIDTIRTFSKQMRLMRQQLESAQKSDYTHERARWFIQSRR